MIQNELKKPCHDDPEHPCECFESLPVDGQYEWCNILLQGGAWEDCRFGKDWPEPEIKFEGD